MKLGLFSYSGGKYAMSKRIIPWFPTDFNNYWEPFCGGISVFRRMVEDHDMIQNRAFLSDLEPNIIKIYQGIKNDPEAVIEYFNAYIPRYIDDVQSLVLSEKEALYYGPREVARSILLRMVSLVGTFDGIGGRDYSKRKNIKRAMQNYDTRNIYDTENKIRLYGETLKIASVRCKDFSIVTGAEKGDLVYLDPPYFGMANRYKKFSEPPIELLYRLRVVMDALTRKGVYCFMSNADNDTVRYYFNNYDFIEFSMLKTGVLRNYPGEKRRELLIHNMGNV